MGSKRGWPSGEIGTDKLARQSPPGPSRLFLGTNRRSVLREFPTGDPLHPTVGRLVFTNEVGLGVPCRWIQVTGEEEIAAFGVPAYLEYSNPGPFLDDLLLSSPPGARSITVFVHGYNNDFKGAVRTLAGVREGLEAAGYGGLFCGFDWCSHGGGHLYGPDLRNMEGSVPHILRFLLELRRACRGKRFAMNIVCHSMGNALFSLVAHRWLYGGRGRKRPWVESLVMLGADIENDLFECGDGGAPRDGRAAGILALCKRVHIGYCPKDGALALSASVAHPHDAPRLGRTGPAPGELPDRVTAEDMSRRGVVVAHGGYLEPKAVARWCAWLAPSEPADLLGGRP